MTAPLMRRMTWAEYVRHVIGDTRQKVVAEKTGIDASVISRWLAGEPPRVDTATKFARAYNRSAIEALLHADFLQQTDVDKPVRVYQSPKDLSASELIMEIALRLPRGRRVSTGDDTSAALSFLRDLGKDA